MQAWSSIVYQLIPNVQQLETNLRNFAQIIEADEVLLFERATFLVRTQKHHDDVLERRSGYVDGSFYLYFFRSSRTISAKSSEMFTALRRSATLSNSLNSAAGKSSPCSRHPFLFSHRIFVSSLFMQQTGSVFSKHGSAELQLCSLHRRLYLQHLRHGHHVRPLHS